MSLPFRSPNPQAQLHQTKTNSKKSQIPRSYKYDQLFLVPQIPDPNRDPAWRGFQNEDCNSAILIIILNTLQRSLVRIQEKKKLSYIHPHLRSVKL